MSLKITDFQKPINFSEMEERVLEYWDQNHIFEKSVSQRPSDNPYVFYDGPPFATGLPHYGHLLASTIKDVIPRYFTMQGFQVERKWGWDCHGLPIENIVEKEKMLADKQAILDFGIDEFNDACHSTVLRFATEWKRIIRRLGRWVDMENDYKTMEPWYMESLWWVFKQLWERKLIYQGHKSMHICPRCATPLSNFEVTQGYKEVKDISVIAEFKVKNTNDRILAWTTTPWTLPGNVLLALNPKATYIRVKGNRDDVRYIIAKERVEFVFGTDPFTVEAELTAKELEGLEYEPLFPYFADTKNAFHTVLADFVTLEEGTGIVHIAPAFGDEDYQVGVREDIELVQHVTMEGKFVAAVTDFAGLSVKPKEDPLSTDIKIIKLLQEKELLFKKINVKHTYPHCWRCDTPLINYATTSWFVKVTDIKSDLLSNNQKINWMPEHIREGRFGKWLENARDWAISRNRFWGTPLPVWQSEDGDTLCIGSIAELESLSGQKVTDLHKQYVDKIEIKQNGKVYKRIPEVLDCWFESGAMPYASFHYPFENKQKFEASFPAKFISEGQDQTRGWFYTLHVLATALTFGKNPAIPVKEPTSSFQNVMVSGIVLAEDGKKMSKRLNNYPDPMIVGQKYGIDALRLYLMNSPVVKAENLNFSENGVEEIRKKVLNISWNIFSFYKLYDDGKTEYSFPIEPVNVLDKWLISRVENATKRVTTALDQYDVVGASREIMQFVDEFSTWWLRQSRDRIKNRENNVEVLQVFRTTLKRLSLLMAPFTPFIAELMYQNLSGVTKESIHLELWQGPNESFIHESLEVKIVEVKKAIEKIHAARKEANLKTRQPLSRVVITSAIAAPKGNLLEIIANEVNVKEVVWYQGEQLGIELDTTLTPALITEGEARELIRKIQDARKAAGTTVDERIDVVLPDWPKEFEAEIMQKVKADTMTKGETLTIKRHD